MGINWLQLVKPVIDWGGARLYVPNVVQTALLQGDWLAGHVQSGTVTVLSAEQELKCMKDSMIQIQISILKCPRFWKTQTKATNLRPKSFDGGVNYKSEWGYLYDNDCEICKRKNGNVKTYKHKNFCKLYVMKIDEGIVKVKRTNVNAKLPIRGTQDQQGTTWLQLSLQ